MHSRYYGPIIFLGALMIILSFLVFLHWLAQFYMDNQERDDVDDILDSDEDEYASSYEQHVKQKSNSVKREKFLLMKKNIEAKRHSLPSIERLKASSEKSSVSDKSVKIRSKNRLAVSLSVKHSNTDMRVSGMIKGVTGIQFPEHGGPDKIRFKLNLQPGKRKRSFRTPLHIPLDASLIIPFQFRLIRKHELKSTVLHVRLFGKKDTFGLPIGPEHCFGEAFISLADLATNVDEINIVQEIIPLGSKPFRRKSIKIRVAEPKFTTREVTRQLEVHTSDVSLDIRHETESKDGESKEGESKEGESKEGDSTDVASSKATVEDI